MSKVLFIDFDETLFYHHSYLSWVDGFLARRGHISSPGDYAALIDDFHEPKGENLRLYRHKDHLKAATGQNWSYISGELEKEIKEKGHDFCYGDAHEFLERAAQSGWDARILTYGHGEYQRYKIKTCRVLTGLGIPIHVVREPKREFIKREFSDATGVLIDDKHSQRLPEGWTHIWITRQDTHKTDDKPDDQNVVRVKSLKEVNL